MVVAAAAVSTGGGMVKLMRQSDLSGMLQHTSHRCRSGEQESVTNGHSTCRTDAGLGSKSPFQKVNKGGFPPLSGIAGGVVDEPVTKGNGISDRGGSRVSC